MTSLSRPIQVGIAAVTAVALLSVWFFSSKKSDNELAPALTEEEALAIMTKILEQLKSKATQLIRAAEGIKQKLAQQGQELDDKKLMKAFILPHFESGLQEIETGVLESHDVDPADLQDAVETYIKQGNSKLKEICDRMRLIYREFGGEVDDLEEDTEESAVVFTEELLITAVEKLSERMAALTEEYIIEFKAENGIPRSEADLQNFQGGLMAISEKVESSVTDELGVPQSAFQRALQTNIQSSARLQQQIMKMSETNVLLMQKHGYDMSSFQ